MSGNRRDPDDFNHTTPNIRINKPAEREDEADFNHTTPNIRVNQPSRGRAARGVEDEDAYGATTDLRKGARKQTNERDARIRDRYDISEENRSDYAHTTNLQQGRPAPETDYRPYEGSQTGALSSYTAPLASAPQARSQGARYAEQQEAPRPAPIPPPVAPQIPQNIPAQNAQAQVAQQNNAAQVAAATTATKSPLNSLLWLAGGAVLLLLCGVFIALYMLLGNPGFTLQVNAAPPQSDVYVNDLPRGVTATDGTITIQGLKAGTRNVRVAHEGYPDFNASVVGKDGGRETLEVKMTGAAQPAGLPARVDLKGPMILIPAGEFQMGDTVQPEESPVHSVTLPDYYIDEHEVTNAQYKEFITQTGGQSPVNPFWSTNYFEQYPDAPVVGISYAEAEAYAKWTGKRLPTEEEWEKAASWNPTAPEGQRKRRFPWGNTFVASNVLLGASLPIMVGKFPAGNASAYGVQGLAGNAPEWVDATYSPYPGNTVANPDYGKNYMVTRGGSFRAESPQDVRTTRRDRSDPAFKTTDRTNVDRTSSLIGFRTAIRADAPNLQDAFARTPKRRE